MIKFFFVIDDMSIYKIYIIKFVINIQNITPKKNPQFCKKEKPHILLN